MIDRDHIEKLIETNKRALRILEEQKTIYGLDPPPRIIISIEDTQAEIARLEFQHRYAKSHRNLTC
jgi:hypothetical protein